MRPRPSWPATCAAQPSQSSNTRFTTIPTGSEDQLEQEPRTQETKGSSPRTRNKRAGRAPHVVSESMTSTIYRTFFTRTSLAISDYERFDIIPAAPKTIQEGTYKICFDEGCLTALGRDQPLVIMGIGQHEHQTWEVKKHGQNQFVIIC
ncbi:uncharacterized protein UBRO2_03965 [Ustilago bromivora]|uniref:Uncharacterized protein n=1 Tax=Ustilago bromivora TaxID=307758 RepID=A0A8H8QP30_9BASI|nr:uncharacterized protein UBRO2_03965 [Ustilago bromivora]